MVTEVKNYNLKQKSQSLLLYSVSHRVDMMKQTGRVQYDEARTFENETIHQTGRVQYDEARSFENETIHTSNNWKLVEA